MRTSSTGNSGFTIVELMVVCVIISVLATMTIPRLYGSAGSIRLRESACRLLVTAKYARDFAVTRRRSCRLVFDSDERRYGLLYQKYPQHKPNEFVPLRGGVGGAERLAESLRFSKVQIERRPRLDGPLPAEMSAGRAGGMVRQRNCITFDPSGQADAAIVEITDGKRAYSTLVAPHTAQARMVAGAVDKTPNDRWDLDE